MRRKRWKAPNDPTPHARQVWAHLFPGEPWPKGWRVAWVGFMRNTLGLTMYRDRRILLNYADAKRGNAVRWCGVNGVVATLLHEFVHMRSGPTLRHGADFRRIETAWLRRMGLLADAETVASVEMRGRALVVNAD